MARGLIIAAPGSSSGKTTACAALARALSARGLRVQTFKVGPDYIDPSYLSAASGLECWNLDGFLTPGLVRWSYRTASEGADLCLVEGVMGLYDGLGPQGFHSTARTAGELGLPVVLLLDCRSASPTLAAQAWGLVNLPGAPEVAGIVLNGVSGPMGELLAASMESLHLPPVLGCIPRVEGGIPSRHLGLVQAFEDPNLTGSIDRLASAVPGELLDGLIRIAREALPPQRLPDLPVGEEVPVALARDEAFSFTYRSGRWALEEMGAHLVEFSPLRESIPEGVRGVILPGGYPEEHMDRLALSPFMESLREAHRRGIPIYAECGGLMVLGRSIRDHLGRSAPMAGLLKLDFAMGNRLSRFGYVTARFDADCLVGRRGERIFGHEFHYSEPYGEEEPLMEVSKASSGRGWRCGYGGRDLFGSYVHLDPLGCPMPFRRFLDRCLASRPLEGGPRAIPGASARREGRALMVMGATSDAGKSFLVTGLCRLFARRGLRVNPFKAQNMALNAYSTPRGELGTAQAVQAEAAMVEPDPIHNPILLKPLGDSVSQVILRGRVYAEASARDYHRHMAKDLFFEAASALRELKASSDLVIMEGAGSPAEMNLYAQDLVNVRMAKFAQAPGILVADIERGGVFASLLGTLQLIPRCDRSVIRALVVNRFRGDPSLFDQGVIFLKEMSRLPVLGVLPLREDLSIPAEDSLNRRDFGSGEVRVAVVALPRMSNFTDFDALGEDRCRVTFAGHPSEIRGAHLVVIPGTKTTLEDLRWLKARGFPRAILEELGRGALVWGICGGYQMLGLSISDPLGVEGGGEEAGLGLLPVRTVFEGSKVLGPARARVMGGHWLDRIAGAFVEGYEIHAGRTILEDGMAPLILDGGIPDGAFGMDGRVFGAYLHGLADDPLFRRALLNHVRSLWGLESLRGEAMSGRAMRDRRYDRLADFLEERLDVGKIEEMVFGGQA
ncbi:cobyric acid synthase CobQ [Thermanaerovibrio acidaminovorans DSM 6589]|uniref:Cobyric acid synthase n=1 Tax=Thermanaerovibrio acidaminovorans (strain ATCC 49978 / DSM 6589 / Su883) TaxID=525903 RepID=D1B7P8_THEAS|nr:cobyric acid synthase [Thermanaerovibrio acidaminovorans]ACZ18301.1 cobyric acid synthase CobQ [Thermanaerovibrio acidaminovorans DSM 6589]